MEFEKDLKSLINVHCLENESNTPDWILAQYINKCLIAYNTATLQRDNWYGSHPSPTKKKVV